MLRAGHSNGAGASIAVIGGSGFYSLSALEEVETVSVPTPFGMVADIHLGRLAATRVAFIARHGLDHSLPPHCINYRANVFALREVGVRGIIAVNAVGGINSRMAPRDIVVPDQLIDYTYGRPHTFADSLSEAVNHIDFTEPFDRGLRQALLSSLDVSGLGRHAAAVYGCTQGPRLETAAEINRLERDGCDIVGMTAMPEAALARELGMGYASLCTVVNWAAGRSPELITMDQVLAILQESNAALQAVVSNCIVRLELS